jgi:hypothetical protein
MKELQKQKRRVGRPQNSFTTTSIKMADLIGAVNVHGSVPVGTLWAKGLGLIRETDDLHASPNLANEK